MEWNRRCLYFISWSLSCYSFPKSGSESIGLVPTMLRGNDCTFLGKWRRKIWLSLLLDITHIPLMLDGRDSEHDGERAQAPPQPLVLLKILFLFWGKIEFKKEKSVWNLCCFFDRGVEVVEFGRWWWRTGASFILKEGRFEFDVLNLITILTFVRSFFFFFLSFFLSYSIGCAWNPAWLFFSPPCLTIPLHFYPPGLCCWKKKQKTAWGMMSFFSSIDDLTGTHSLFRWGDSSIYFELLLAVFSVIFSEGGWSVVPTGSPT